MTWGTSVPAIMTRQKLQTYETCSNKLLETETSSCNQSSLDVALFTRIRCESKRTDKKGLTFLSGSKNPTLA